MSAPLSQEEPERASLTPSSSSKYSVIVELGHGGMATAYLAAFTGPRGFNKLVVLKRLRSALAAEPEFLEMFLEEARLSARIDHPNVVHTTEVGFDGQHHYIAMEYLDGQAFETISRRLLKNQRNGVRGSDAPPSELGGEAALPLKFHLHVISQALLGLDCAHELTDFDGTPLNVVHRDVSPHNIVVTYDGHVKLLDFGIAKAADSSGETRTGVMKGKCAYMPPEQFSGRRVDRRADIFAVGVILWQALTGRRMWRGMLDVEILQKVSAGEIKSPSSVNPSVPPELDAICMKALALDPSERFATASEFQIALEDYISTHPELRTTPRELGRFVSELFREDREKMRAMIEAQLGRSSSSGLGSTPAFPGSTGSLPQSKLHFARLPSGRPAQAATVVDRTAMSAAPFEPGMKRRLTASIVVALAALLVLGVVALRHHAPVAEIAASPVPPSGLPSGAPPPFLDSVLRVHSLPEDARLSFDGALLDGHPESLTFRRDGLSHRITGDAPGYVSKTEWVSFDKAEVIVEIDLERAPAEADSGPVSVAVSARTPSAPVQLPRRRAPVDSPTAPAATAASPIPTTPAPPAPATPTLRGSPPHGPMIDNSDPWAPPPHPTTR